MFGAFPIQFILYLCLAATFPEGGRLIEVGLYLFTLYIVG